jgi:hypothetical protein
MEKTKLALIFLGVIAVVAIIGFLLMLKGNITHLAIGGGYDKGIAEVFKLPPLSRNLRNEIKKSKKIYFYDNGIRNALINNLNPVEIRQDVGSLWENFFIVERMKFLKNAGIDKNIYFWRTFQKQEIDYIEEENNIFHAFEIKWSKAKAKVPDIFSSTYPLKEFTVVQPKNYREYLRG